MTPYEILKVAPLLLLLGILTCALLYTLFAHRKSAVAILTIRQICFASSLAALAVGLTMSLTFDKAAVGYQFMFRAGEVAEYNTSFAIGVDGLSYVFLILTLFTFPFLFLAA